MTDADRIRTLCETLVAAGPDPAGIDVTVLSALLALDIAVCGLEVPPPNTIEYNCLLTDRLRTVYGYEWQLAEDWKCRLVKLADRSEEADPPLIVETRR